MGFPLTILVVTVISVISSPFSTPHAVTALKRQIWTRQHVEKNFARFMGPPKKTGDKAEG